MTQKHPNPNLIELARQEVSAAGFSVVFSDDIIAEVHSANARAIPDPSDIVKDLRNLLWSSIDNEESKDLDQIEFVEKIADGSFRLLVGIADVDAFVRKDSATDKHAAQNTVTVYTPVAIFPMLPVELSNQATSLLEGQDRIAIVIELVIGPDGLVTSRQAYSALVRNRSKLNYQEIGDWLDDNSDIPSKLRASKDLTDQIQLQYDCTQLLKRLRRRNGALEFDSVEADATTKDGQVTGIIVRKTNRARDIIESFMVAANSQMAEFLEERQIPSLRRVVRTPERWPRIVELAASFGEQLPDAPDVKALSNFLQNRRKADPEGFADISLAVMKLMGPGEYLVESPGVEQDGHFGLAVHDYTHSTAPNRRYPDLVTQRLIKASLAGAASPYSIEELETIAKHCTEMEDAARKIERTTLKAAIATVLAGRVGDEFDAVVTGVKQRGTFVRITDPPAEGLVVAGAHGLDVGDRIRVRLVGTNPERGFIDFAVSSRHR